MDRLSRADAVLADLASRSPAVLLPGRVTSPMDCQTTTPVSRTVIDDCEARASRSAPASTDPVMDEEMLRLSAGPPKSGHERHSA